MTRKEIRKNRWWKHILFHLPERIFGRDLREISGYDPERWRYAFERFQSRGGSALTSQEMDGIWPLICAQKGKEILLTSLATECMEYWAKGWGWMLPISSTLEAVGDKPLERLTRVAILRMAKKMGEDSVGFFMRHPGIEEVTKQRFLGMFLETTKRWDTLT